MDILVTVYHLFTRLATPFIYLFLLKRQRDGKEDDIRFGERFGRPTIPRPEGHVIWFHAASVGESVSILPLIERIASTYPQVHILLTTGTVSSASMIESRLPKKAFHQYVMVDHIDYVRRFLRHWRPSMAFWVESELWPNMVTETSKYCSLYLLNARVSDRSFRKWQIFNPFARYILSHFELILAQSKRDAKRLRDIGAQEVRYVGNIKNDAPALPSDPKKMGELVSMIGDRPVWLAASTHNGEEEIVVEIHALLKEIHPHLLTIIAPRHPTRAAEIAAMVKAKDLRVARRSENVEVTSDTDVYLADTIGELGIFYRLVPIVYIGGSLVPHGGQNPLEPARLECAVVFGPHMENFSEVSRELLQNKAAQQIQDRDGLRHCIDKLLGDHHAQSDLASTAYQLVEEKAGVVDHFMHELEPFLREKFGPKEESDVADAA